MEEKINEAITLIRAGNKLAGAKILQTILQQDRNNERAWLWMSACTEKPEDKKRCLETVLGINPDNESAKKALAKLGYSFPTPSVQCAAQAAASQPQAKKSNTGLLLFIIFLLLCVPVALALVMGSRPKPETPVANLSFFDIVEQYNARTDVQREGYINSLKGKRVIWDGYIDNVNQDMLSIHVWVYPTDYTQDTTRFYFDVPVSQAGKFSRGQKIRVDGKIAEAGYWIRQFQVKLSDVDVIETP